MQVELGYQHTCTLLDNGKVKCFGYNFGMVTEIPTIGEATLVKWVITYHMLM